MYKGHHFEGVDPFKTGFFFQSLSGNPFFHVWYRFFRKSKDFESQLGPRSEGPPCQFSSLFSSWGPLVAKVTKSRPQEAQKPSPRASGSPFEVIFVRFLSRFEFVFDFG